MNNRDNFKEYIDIIFLKEKYIREKQDIEFILKNIYNIHLNIENLNNNNELCEYDDLVIQLKNKLKNNNIILTNIDNNIDKLISKVT
jgi:hypothetical protein